MRKLFLGITMMLMGAALALPAAAQDTATPTPTATPTATATPTITDTPTITFTPTPANDKQHLNPLFPIPSGPLPWALPDLPQIPEVADVFASVPDESGDPTATPIPTPTQITAPESEAQIDAAEDQIGDMEGVVNDAEAWFATPVDGDFSFGGLQPDGVPVGAATAVAQIGADVGTVIEYGRTLQIFDFHGSGGVFGFLLFALGFIIFVKLLSFSVSIIAFVISWIIRIIDLIGNYLPFT
jgi:hypothetical protein